jgi:hypothetical protein
MEETFTTTLNVTINKAIVKETDAIELLGANEMMFYHTIRTDLDMLRRVPKKQTIDHILNFSKGKR